MTQVSESLFVGDQETAKKLCGNFTHVLTLESAPVDLSLPSSIQYKFVCLDDLDDADLLSEIELFTAFIYDGISSGGKVLVHCLNGISRSSAACLAFLMKTKQIEFDEAYQELRLKYPKASPNSGFIRQLEIFGASNYGKDKSNPLYRQHILRQMIKQFVPGSSAWENALSSFLSTSEPHSEEASSLYKCHKCRRTVFSSQSLVPHPEGSGYGSNFSSGDSERICLQSIFIEPVKWMKDDILQLSGKLYCPSCRSKIGSFTWSGEQCTCGNWVTPAFHIRKNCVDLAACRR